MGRTTIPLPKAFSSTHQAIITARQYSDTLILCSFLHRLFCITPEVHARLTPLYKECCCERIGLPGDALALAMRIVCCTAEGIDASIDALRLGQMQEVDGGWKNGWFYRYPIEGILVANNGFTTSLAVNALNNLE